MTLANTEHALLSLRIDQTGLQAQSTVDLHT